MRKVTFTIAGLRAQPRPSSYLDELAACAVERNETTMTFDLNDPRFRKVLDKYHDYRPTAEDLERARANAVAAAAARHARGGISLDNATSRAAPPPKPRRCGGCRGRKLAG